MRAHHSNDENKNKGEATEPKPTARAPLKSRSASALLREIRREVKRAIG